LLRLESENAVSFSEAARFGCLGHYREKAENRGNQLKHQNKVCEEKRPRII